MAFSFSNDLELADCISALKRENEALKKALLEMKDAAEEWKALAESFYRWSRQEWTKEDMVRVKDYQEALQREKENKPL